MIANYVGRARLNLRIQTAEMNLSIRLLGAASAREEKFRHAQHFSEWREALFLTSLARVMGMFGNVRERVRGMGMCDEESEGGFWMRFLYKIEVM